MEKQGIGMDVIQVWAQRLEVEAGLQAQLSLEVGQIDATVLKQGLVALLRARADLMQTLRDGLVQTADPSLMMIAQLAASGADMQVAVMREAIQAVRAGVGQAQIAEEPKVTLS